MAEASGIYLVYRRYPKADGTEERRIVGRFAILSGNVYTLEDHDGIVSDVFPSGPVTDQITQRIRAWENGNSPYWEVVPESDVEEGQREDLMPELKLDGGDWRHE